MLENQLLPLYKVYPKSPYGTSVNDPVVGIEFENEVKNSTEVEEIGFPNTIGPWKFHSENSLRYYGFEYVSKPLKLGSVTKEVNKLFNSLRERFSMEKLKFTNSIRTSVHVHFEVLHMNTLQVVNFATLYWIMEPYLQHFCGKHRQGNLFCIRMRDSAYIKSEIAKVLNSGSMLTQQPLSTESMRYASVNFNSILKFGTLEFRIMRGVSHERPALLWITALERIRKFSLKFKDPLELRKWFLDDVEAENVPKEVLGKLVDTFNSYLPYDANVRELIQDGYFSVVQIFTANNDYSEKRVAEEKKKAEKASKAFTIKYATNIKSTTLTAGPIEATTYNPFLETEPEDHVYDSLNLTAEETDYLETFSAHLTNFTSEPV